MSGHLKLSMRADGNGLAQLFAEFEINGFSGKGNACVDVGKLAEEAKKFAQFPLASEKLPCIEGGYWSEDDATKLCEEHLHISVSPADLRGGLLLEVRVGVPRDEADRPGLRYSAAAEFRTNYEQIAELSKDLVALVNGDKSDVMFTEVDG
jgi:hypothetical protein